MTTSTRPPTMPTSSLLTLSFSSPMSRTLGPSICHSCVMRLSLSHASPAVPPYTLYRVLRDTRYSAVCETAQELLVGDLHPVVPAVVQHEPGDQAVARLSGVDAVAASARGRSATARGRAAGGSSRRRARRAGRRRRPGPRPATSSRALSSARPGSAAGPRRRRATPLVAASSRMLARLSRYRASVMPRATSLVPTEPRPGALGAAHPARRALGCASASRTSAEVSPRTPRLYAVSVEVGMLRCGPTTRADPAQALGVPVARRRGGAEEDEREVAAAPRAPGTARSG